jgi:CTP:phosphocholine cytidylyltransferase-like protein
MKTLLTIIILTVTASIAQGQEISEKNDPKKHPNFTNKNHVDKIDGRPIDFYLRHKAIDTPAKMFYKGEYALYDDEETFRFLDGILTDNAETRPFYLFIYNQAMEVTDGALAEYMTSICRRYLEKYPCEFLLHLNDKVSRIDVEKWTGFIGFDVYDKETFDKFVMGIDQKVKGNCPTRKSYWDKVKIKIEEKLEVK